MKNTSQVSGKHGAALEGRACPLLRAAGERGLPTAPFSADTRSGSPHAGALRGELARRARIGKGPPPAVDPEEPEAPLHSSGAFSKCVFAAFCLPATLLPDRRTRARPAGSRSSNNEWLEADYFFLNKTKSGVFFFLYPLLFPLSHTLTKKTQP